MSITQAKPYAPVFITLAAFLLVGWNYFWIESRVIGFDETAIIDTALHGTLGHWSALLPPETRIVSDMDSHATRSGHCRMMEYLCHIFGIGVVQIRLPGLIAGCAAL